MLVKTIKKFPIVKSLESEILAYFGGDVVNDPIKENMEWL